MPLKGWDKKISFIKTPSAKSRRPYIIQNSIDSFIDYLLFFLQKIFRGHFRVSKWNSTFWGSSIYINDIEISFDIINNIMWYYKYWWNGRLRYAGALEGQGGILGRRWNEGQVKVKVPFTSFLEPSAVCNCCWEDGFCSLKHIKRQGGTRRQMLLPVMWPVSVQSACSITCPGLSFSTVLLTSIAIVVFQS